MFLIRRRPAPGTIAAGSAEISSTLFTQLLVTARRLTDPHGGLMWVPDGRLFRKRQTRRLSLPSMSVEPHEWRDG